MRYAASLDQPFSLAFAAGVPVIGSATEAITAVVSHGKQKLVFRDKEQLIDYIRTLRDDLGLRKKLAEGALEETKKYNIRDVIKRLCLVCQIN